MKTDEDLRKAEAVRDVFAKQQKAVIERLSAEVERLWNAGGRAGNPMYEEAYWKLENAKRVEKEYTEKYTQAVEVIRAERQKARVEAERQATVNAARAEQVEREKARSVWLSAGGAPAQFEASWPGIYQRLLEDKTVSALKAEKKPSSHLVEY